MLVDPGVAAPTQPEHGYTLASHPLTTIRYETNVGQNIEHSDSNDDCPPGWRSGLWSRMPSPQWLEKKVCRAGTCRHEERHCGHGIIRDLAG